MGRRALLSLRGIPGPVGTVPTGQGAPTETEPESDGRPELERSSLTPGRSENCHEGPTRAVTKEYTWPL